MTKLNKEQQSFLEKLRDEFFLGQTYYNFWKMPQNRESSIRIIKELKLSQLQCLISRLEDFRLLSDQSENSKVNRCIFDVRQQMEYKRKQERQEEEKQKNQKIINLLDPEIIYVKPKHPHKFEQQQDQVNEQVRLQQKIQEFQSSMQAFGTIEQNPTLKISGNKKLQNFYINTKQNEQEGGQRGEMEQQLGGKSQKKPTTKQQQQRNGSQKNDQAKQFEKGHCCWCIKYFIGILVSFILTLLGLVLDLTAGKQQKIYKLIWGIFGTVTGVAILLFIYFSVKKGIYSQFWKWLCKFCDKEKNKQSGGLGNGTFEQAS